MVMDDPDRYDMEDSEQIGIFVPGADIEREVSRDRLIHALLLTGSAFVLMLGVTFVLMIPLMAGGFIILYPNGTIYFADWVMLFLSIAEMVFVVPPIWYVRKHGLKLSSSA